MWWIFIKLGGNLNILGGILNKYGGLKYESNTTDDNVSTIREILKNQ
jgi:hypothetical protein